VKQFVHDHIIPESRIERQQIKAEAEATVAGAGGPFALHRAEGDGRNGYIELPCTVMHPRFESVFVRGCLPGHGEPMRSALARRVNSSSTTGVTCSKVSHASTRAKVTFWRRSCRSFSLVRQQGMARTSNNSERLRASASSSEGIKVAESRDL